MSNSVVQKIRERFPTLEATDAEITLAIYDATRPNPVFDDDKDFVNQALDYKVALGASRPGTELGRSFRSGVDVAQAKLYDTLALAGEVTGLEKLKEVGDEGYERNIAEAQENAPTIPSIINVRSPSEFARYALGLTGSQAPQIGGTLASAAGGAAIGGAVGGPAGALAGAVLGGGAAGFTQMQSFGELSRQPGVDRSAVVPTAVGVGALGAILESLVPFKVTSAFLRTASKEVAKEYLERVVTKVPVNALAEGGTEVAQEIVTMAGELYANRNNPTFNLTDTEVRNRLVNAGFAGAMLGAPLGAIEAIAKRKRPEDADKTAVPPTPRPVREPDETELDYGAGGELPATPSTAIPTPDLPIRQFVTGPTDAASQFVGTRDEAEATAMAKVVVEDLLSGASRENTYTSHDRQYYRQVRGQIESEVQDAIAQGIGRENTLAKYLGTSPQLPADGQDREQPTEVVKESAGTSAGDSVPAVAPEPVAEPPQAASAELFERYRAAESAQAVEQRRLQAEAERLRRGREQALDIPEPVMDQEMAEPAAFGSKLSGVSPVLSVPEPAPEIHPLVYEIDFESRVLPGQEEESERGVKEGEAKQIQHALFEVTDMEYSPELGERLTNESRSKKESALNTETHRITFFENQETGLVVGLPTYYTKSSGRGAQYRTAPLPGETKGSTVENLMKNGLWIPVVSVRTRDSKYALEPKNVLEFEDFRDFENRFLNAARTRSADTRSTVEAVERTMVATVTGFESGEEVELESEATPEEPNPMMELADIVIEFMPKVRGKVPTDLTIRDFENILVNAVQEAENNRAIRFAALEALKQLQNDKEFLLKSTVEQKITVAQDIARGLHERYKSAIEAGKFEPNEIRLYLGPAQSETAAGFNRSSAERDAADTERFNLRAKESGPVVTAEFMATAKALADAGVPVNIFKQVAGSLIQEFIDAEGRITGNVMGGVYDRATKMVSIVLGDPANPRQSNLETLFEEAGHALFDRESPEARDNILRAVSRLSDHQLGLTRQQLDAIRNAYPEGAAADVIHEERLMAVISATLVREGFNPTQSRGIASAILRFIKDLYLRGVMAIQRMLLGPRYDNPVIAQQYFQNRLESFLSQDSASLPGFIQRLGGGKPLPAREVRVYSPANGNRWTVERYNYESNSIEYGDVLHDTVEAVMLNARNALRFSVPAPGSPDQFSDPAIRLNTQAAINNWLRDLQSAVAAKANVSIEVVRKTFGLTNTSAVRLNLARQAQGVNNFRPDQKASDFRQEWNLKSALQGAYNNTFKQTNKIGGEQADAIAQVEVLKQRKQDLIERHAEDVKNYVDADGLTNEMVFAVQDLTRETMREFLRGSRRLGRIEQQIAALEGQIGKPIPREYGTALRKLFTGDQLSGERLFSFLERLALDPGIDVSQPVPVIRDDLQTIQQSNPNDDYARLLDNTREGKALLATVVAFAKAHRILMTKLALRRSTNLAERATLNEELARLKSQSLPDIIKGIKSVARIASVEERARLEYRKAQLAIRKVDRGIKRLEDKAKLASQAVPEFQKSLRNLESQLELSANFIIHDGAEVLVPERSDMTTEELKEAPRQILRLSTANGTPTEPVTVDGWVKNMSLFMQEREARAEDGNAAALDSYYYFIKRQFDELMGWKFEPFLQASDHTASGLALSSAPLQMESFGTPASRMVAQMVRIFQATKASLNNIGTRLGIANVSAENRVLKSLSEGRKNGFRRDFYRDFILYPAIGFLENRNRTFTEEFSGSDEALRSALMQRLENYLLSNDAVRPWIGDRLQDFMPALEGHIQALVRSNQAFQSAIDEAGLGVKDPKLRNQLRKAFAVGPITVARTINSHVFTPMVTALDNSGWAPDPRNDGKSLASEDFRRSAELYNAGQREELDSLLRKYFNHPEYGNTVDRMFVRELANMPDNSAFDGPTMEDGVTQPPANPVLVAQAYADSNRNILSFIEGIYDLHDGTTDKGQFVQGTLERMADIYFEARTIKNKIDPDVDAKVTTLKGMIPGFMIDARLIDHLPDAWFRYHSFDPMDNARIAERIAGQIAFGRDQERLSDQFGVVAGEVKSSIERLRVAEAETRFENPTTNKKDLEKGIAQKLGGKEEWKRLRTIAARNGLMAQFQDQMVSYFRNRSDPVGNLHYATRLAQTLAGLAVNQISSALAQLATLFDMNLRYGAAPSMLKGTVRNIFLVAKDLSGSLAQSIGWEIWKNSYFEDQYQRLGFNDPDSARKLGDLLAPLEGEDRFVGFLRRVRDVQSTPFNRRGNDARFTAFRPAAPFLSSVLSANKAITISTWSLAKNYVLKGLNHLTAHPELDKLTPENLGLSGLERDSFLRFQQDLNRYGLDFNAMVKGAKDRQSSDKVLLTDKELARMYSMALNEVSLENNIATMPLAAFNNSVLRFVLPLLGWSYRRALQVASLRLDTSGKNSMASLAKGLVGLAAISTGALGLSALIDDYQERILGKARNLRKLRGLPDTGEDWLAIVERLGRMGTTGLFGELINSAVNVGTGQGDNRALSADARVLALSNLQSLIRAASSFINQDFNADYSHVVRPFLTSIGGGGTLQYIQLANRAFGLDNVESRVTARINASNYLRVAGRELGLSIRTGQAGYGTPTPITPFISNMEYAAYANDPLDFRRAYLEAVTEAREAGKEKPEDYVKRSFESRHPLRFVFQTVPSEQEYRAILASLNDKGREDVATAIRLFNFYGGKLKIAPMQGRKRQPGAKTSSAEARARALAL